MGRWVCVEALPMTMAKQSLRDDIWRTMTLQKLARFPGAQGRIPNFIGAEAAAQHLTTLSVSRQGCTLKCNPDASQRSVRYAALRPLGILWNELGEKLHDIPVLQAMAAQQQRRC